MCIISVILLPYRILTTFDMIYCTYMQVQYTQKLTDSQLSVYTA